MPVANFDYPGVRVVESTAGAIPIDRRSFRAIKLTGTALRGPSGLNLNPITRERMFQDIYGPDVTTSFLHDAIRAIFGNVDTSEVFINRVVGAGAAKATKTLQKAPSTNVLKIDALGPGADYNFTAIPAHGLSVTYVDGDLTVYDEGVAVEVYRNVVFGNAQKSADEINGQSNLIQITWLDMTQNPDNVAAPTGLLGGLDGAAVTAADIAGSSSNNTGIYAFARKDLPLGFLLAPGYPQAAVGNALIAVAEGYRQLALIDSTFGNSVSQAITERNTFAAPKGHAIYCYGWAQILDAVTGAKKFVPRSPYRAAHIARSHSQPGFLANVGAGLDYVLRGALGLETGNMDDLTQGSVNVRGIDVARNFNAFGQGLVQWSARTISTNPLYRFLQVRVILNVIADSIEIGLRPYVFQTYDGRGRKAAEIKGSIDQLLWDLWNQDSLFGGSAGEAFLVKNVSTLSELEQGIINLEVYVKPTSIIERINVTLFRVPLNFNFNTGAVDIGDIESRAA